MGKRTQTLDRGTLPRRQASRSLLFTVYVEAGVLRVLFNEAASWELVRHLFLKIDTLMNLSSCSVVHRGLPLLFLFWLETVCAVLWRGVVHSVVQDLQFLGNFSHGIALISPNKNRLKKFFCFWPFWTCNRTHKCWCSRYSTSLKKASFIASLNQHNSFQLR